MRAPSWLARASIRLRSGSAAEAALVALLFAFAFVLRYPRFRQIPRFTDEVRFMDLAAAMAQGGPWPLVYEGTGYNGPFLIWLLALARVVSPAIDTPRWILLLLGSLGVVLMYAAARALHGRLAGLFAASLLACSFVPILVFSHVAWYVSLAFFFMLVCLWSVVTAVVQGRGAWLAVAGIALGLAAGQYPLVAVFVPGLLAWMATEPRGRRLLRSRWMGAAAVACLLGLAPIALYHWPQLLNRQSLELSGGYNQVLRNVGAASYGDGVRMLLLSTADAVSGAAHGSDYPPARDGLLLWIGALLAIGLAAALRRRVSLPVWLILWGVVLTPVIIRDYDFPMRTRYSAVLLPAVYLGAGIGMAILWQSAHGRGALVRRTVHAAVAVSLVVAMIGPLVRLRGYYREQSAVGRDNSGLLLVTDYMASAGLPIVLDGDITSRNTKSGNPSNVLWALCHWQGTPCSRHDDPAALDADLASRTEPAVVVIAHDHRELLAVRDRLIPIAGLQITDADDVAPYAVYRYMPTMAPGKQSR